MSEKILKIQFRKSDHNNFTIDEETGEKKEKDKRDQLIESEKEISEIVKEEFTLGDLERQLAGLKAQKENMVNSFDKPIKDLEAKIAEVKKTLEF